MRQKWPESQHAKWAKNVILINLTVRKISQKAAKDGSKKLFGGDFSPLKPTGASKTLLIHRCNPTSVEDPDPHLFLGPGSSQCFYIGTVP